RAARILRRLRILPGSRPESRSDPRPSIRGTRRALRGNTLVEEPVSASSSPSCRCHRLTERYEFFEGRRQGPPKKPANQNARRHSRRRAPFLRAAPRASLCEGSADQFLWRRPRGCRHCELLAPKQKTRQKAVLKSGT